MSAFERSKKFQAKRKKIGGKKIQNRTRGDMWRKKRVQTKLQRSRNETDAKNELREV